MSKDQYVPIGRRTRLQLDKYYENQTRISRQTRIYRQTTHEVIDVDEYETKKNATSKASTQTDHDDEAGPSRTKVRVKASESLDDSDSEENQEDSLQSTEDDSLSSSEDDQLSSSDSDSESEDDQKKSSLENTKKKAQSESVERNEKKTASKTSSENEAGPSRSKVTVKESYNLDDSDSEEKQEGSDESHNDIKADSVQSTEDDSLSSNGTSETEYGPLRSSDSDSESEDEQSSSTESDSDDSEDSNFLPLKRKKSLLENTKKKARSEPVERNVIKEEESNAESEESDGVEELNSSDFEKAAMETVGYSSEDSIKTGTHTYFFYSSDDSDAVNKQQEADGSQSNMKADTVRSPKDDPSSSSSSENEDEPPMNRSQSPIENTKKKVDESSSDTKSSKDSPKDVDGSVDAILDSVIESEGVQGKRMVESYKFRFEDSEDESTSPKTDEFGADGLFEEMNFALECEEIGSSRAPTVEEQQEDDNISQIDRCQRGEHGEVYLDEQIGLRCCLCGAVVLETKYVIPKLATYTPSTSKRRYQFDEQHFDGHENQYIEDSNCNQYNIPKNLKGTVWELIPPRARALYPHQKEGFKFLWENLAGTIEVSELLKLGPRGSGGGGGGCIISHAPGTGKTLLTIVFVETFLKMFPRCCPLIIAPASMLLTWEAEFKEWEAGFTFFNLSSSEFLRKEMIKGSSRYNKDRIRAIKLSSWSNGGSVLGISYNLYTKLAGNSNTNNKMRDVLLNMPGLVVLDEGHTPRNENSNCWNTLLKLKTKNRVILSGTPFQNNFQELFNTLRLVRPEIAANIVNGKIFAEMIQQNRKTSTSKSAYEDVEKLKKIISPFVHVHEGHILERQLPGLKKNDIRLEPPPLQKSFIQNLGNMTNFEYDHKVALVSVHPSLILHCSLSEKEEKLVNKQELEKMRLQPDYGVKTRFVMEFIRLSVALGEKVLIFSQYIQPLELLKDQISRVFDWNVGREMLLIEGKITQKHRQTIINDFNDPKSKVKVLLASTKCCSEGIHLVGASRVVLLDTVWNPSVESQAISRAYRLGQKKVVYTYHLMTAGTTEEQKYDRQVEKGRLAKLVFSKSDVDGEEQKKKEKVVELDDKILQEMMNHRELKDMFKKD